MNNSPVNKLRYKTSARSILDALNKTTPAEINPKAVKTNKNFWEAGLPTQMNLFICINNYTKVWELKNRCLVIVVLRLQIGLKASEWGKALVWGSWLESMGLGLK